MNQISSEINDTKKNGGVVAPFFTALLLVCALFGGLAVGYGVRMLTQPANTKVMSKVSQQLDGSNQQGGVTFDKTIFKDSAEGILREGGFEDEGTHYLERPGGKSQNVYMYSNTVDLSLFVGKKVKIWGATQTAQKAGWLMDVGGVEQLAK